MQQVAISFMRIVLFGIKQKAKGGRCTQMPPSVLCKYGFQAVQEICAIAAAAAAAYRAARASGACDRSSSMHDILQGLEIREGTVQPCVRACACMEARLYFPSGV